MIWKSHNEDVLAQFRAVAPVIVVVLLFFSLCIIVPREAFQVKAFYSVLFLMNIQCQ
jgi:hypothetical protein